MNRVPARRRVRAKITDPLQLVAGEYHHRLQVMQPFDLSGSGKHARGGPSAGQNGLSFLVRPVHHLDGAPRCNIIVL